MAVGQRVTEHYVKRAASWVREARRDFAKCVTLFVLVPAALAQSNTAEHEGLA
jgi:hypothetical protein